MKKQSWILVDRRVRNVFRVNSTYFPLRCSWYVWNEVSASFNKINIIAFTVDMILLGCF